MKAFFALSAMIFSFATGAMAQTTNTLSDAEIQGRILAQQLCDALPAENLANTGVLQINDGKGMRWEIPIKCEVFITTPNWQSFYEASWTNKVEKLLVVHTANQSNSYFYETNNMGGVPSLYDVPILGHLFRSPQKLSGAETMIPFAGSDFWVADLGLEFFHWREQKVMKKEIKRSRGCTVLESMNPNPSPNGYSRVVSWIDDESGGIVQAEAYDFNDKLFKEFAPKSFKKVNGQWELQEMEIRNIQTGSRTRLEFDLKSN